MKQKTIHNRNKHPQGSTIIEFLTAGVLLATVMTFLAPFISRVAIVNETIADRELVLRELQAIVTELQQGKQNPGLSTAVTSQLENPKLEITKNVDEQSTLGEVTVSVSWINRFGERHPPLALSFWQPDEAAE